MSNPSEQFKNCLTDAGSEEFLAFMVLTHQEQCDANKRMIRQRRKFMVFPAHW